MSDDSEHLELVASFGAGIACCLSEILNEIATSTETLENILKKSPGYPTMGEFYAHLHASPLLQKLYRRARELRCEVIQDQLLAIADTPEVGKRIRLTPKGEIVETSDMIDHRRLKIDTRKWLLGKMKPREFGDKQTTEHVGKDGEPLTITFKSILEEK